MPPIRKQDGRHHRRDPPESAVRRRSGSRRKVAKSASAGAKRSRCRGRAADPFGGRRSDLHAGGRRDEADVHNFVDQIAAKYGRLDVCFNNAGITVQNALHEYTSAEWDDVINTICAGTSWR
jgi:NAD(P)-dependent dehydrogenase (short-subunit alcohol dehydrogenase family)